MCWPDGDISYVLHYMCWPGDDLYLTSYIICVGQLMTYILRLKLHVLAN